MIRFLFASHGSLGREFISTVEMIMGECKNLDFISMNPHTSIQEAREQLNLYLNKKGTHDQTIILTDVLGGSITNVCLEFLNRKDIYVITGINLPLVLELLMVQHTMDITQMIEHAVSQAKQGIVYVNPLINENK